MIGLQNSVMLIMSYTARRMTQKIVKHGVVKCCLSLCVNQPQHTQTKMAKLIEHSVSGLASVYFFWVFHILEFSALSRFPSLSSVEFTLQSPFFGWQQQASSGQTKHYSWISRSRSLCWWMWRLTWYQINLTMASAEMRNQVTLNSTFYQEIWNHFDGISKRCKFTMPRGHLQWHTTTLMLICIQPCSATAMLTSYKTAAAGICWILRNFIAILSENSTKKYHSSLIIHDSWFMIHHHRHYHHHNNDHHKLKEQTKKHKLCFLQCYCSASINKPWITPIFISFNPSLLTKDLIPKARLGTMLANTRLFIESTHPFGHPCRKAWSLKALPSMTWQFPVGKW